MITSRTPGAWSDDRASRAACTPYLDAASPHTRTRPAVGTRIPVSTLMVVDLPALLGPSSPTASPGAILLSCRGWCDAAAG